MNAPSCTNNDIDALEIKIIEIVLYLNTNLHIIVYFFSCSDSWLKNYLSVLILTGMFQLVSNSKWFLDYNV